MNLADRLAAIDDLAAQIAAHGPLPDAVRKRVDYKLRLEWNYHSNSMEGNSLTKEETRSVMVNNITVEGKPLKDVLEMRGHDGVVQDIMKMGRGELRLSESRIRDVHRAIMNEESPEQAAKIGKWKTGDNYALNYRSERFDYAPHAEVPERMHTLINWLNAEGEKIARDVEDALHPVLLALKFHLDYVSIHPFYDGNGRTARIFTNLILAAYGYPPMYVKTDERETYYQYLADVQAYDAPPDLLFDFMAGLVERSLRIVLDAVEGREIEEMGDLNKKLALLKKRLGQPHDASVEMRYSSEAVMNVVEQSMMPFAKAWEARLKDFDPLFQSRSIMVSAENIALQDVGVDEALFQFRQRKLLPYLASGDAKPIKLIKLQCNLANLTSVNKMMGVNGGEAYFHFYPNKYELEHIASKYNGISRLYGHNLTESEIASMVEAIGNWVYDNIEKILQDEEK